MLTRFKYNKLQYVAYSYCPIISQGNLCPFQQNIEMCLFQLALSVKKILGIILLKFSIEPCVTMM